MSRKGRVWQEGRAKGAPARRGVPWYFVVDIASPGAPRKQLRRRGFATREEAQADLDRLLAQVRGGSYVEPSKRTLGAYLVEWLDSLSATGKRTTTLHSYRRTLEAHVIDADVGQVPLQAVTPLDLDRLYAQLVTDGHRQREGRGLSFRTVRYVHTIVAKALSDAERKGLISRNPARLASPPSSTAAKAPEMHVWTPQELRRFLEAVPDHHHGPVWHMAAMTGLRRGELCGLRWADVDLDGGSITVRQTITSTTMRELVVGDVKTARSRRTVELDAGSVAVLSAHRKAQLQHRVLMGGGYSDHGLVVAMPDGRPWDPQVITRAFDRLVKAQAKRERAATAEAPLPVIRLHDLRHTHATHLLAAGVNVKVVSERLGHASTAFTLDTYAHVMPGQQADAAAAVAALVGADVSRRDHSVTTLVTKRAARRAASGETAGHEGAGCRIRTDDRSITSRVLYRLS
jgi:integrase